LEDRDARRLARVQEANAIDIDEVDLFQIQPNVWSPALNLRFQLPQVLRPKLAAYTNARPATAGNSFDL
jgi:hypothetical protein